MEKKQLASYILISLFLVHYSVSHSAYIFLNYYLNNFKLFEISLRKGECYTSFIINNNNNLIRMYLVTHYLTRYIFWWDRKVQFSNSINITFILCISQFLLLKTFSFDFLQDFLCINSVSQSLSLEQLNLLCHLSSCFGVSDIRIFVDAVHAGYRI